MHPGRREIPRGDSALVRRSRDKRAEWHHTEGARHRKQCLA